MCIGVGAGAIIAMTLAISLIITILNVLNGFNHTDEEKVKLMKMLGAGRMQVFFKLVMPALGRSRKTQRSSFVKSLILCFMHPFMPLSNRDTLAKKGWTLN